MSFLKKVFKRSKETSEEKSAKQQEVNLSLDDSFVHYFLEKGGKFLYCTKKEEIEFHLQNIIKENNWKELVCLDNNLTKLIDKKDVTIKSDINYSAPFFTTCEHLIADNGDVLFSSNQLKSKKLASLSEHFIVYATTSQLVKNTGEGLTGIKTNFKENIPTNISAIKNYSINKKDDNFLNYGNSNSKTYICCCLKIFNMQNLLTRSISGFVYVTLFLFAILYDEKSYIALTSIFAVICIWEFSKLIHSKNIIPYLFLGGMLYFFMNPIEGYSSQATLSFTIVGLLILVYLLFSSKKIMVDTMFQRLFLQLIYLVLPFYFLISIPFIFGDYQPEILICILIFIWVNDSFAYLVGKNFGKNKLFKSVSPKKTIEGFIGGLVFSLIAAFFITQQHNNQKITLLDWMIIAAILSIIGTIGDLIESKFKRQANIKDSGNIMPGHGGLLDRLDSLFFAAPFVYLYLYFII